jgi:Xaa-Pro aminopeptidase
MEIAMINMIEYAKRRKALMQKIDPNGIVILPAAVEVLRNGDALYPYRQNSDFHYLTGFPEAEAVLILAPNHQPGDYILFNRVRDPQHEIWDGPRAGQRGACKQFLADRAFPIRELETRLPALLAKRKAIYYPLGKDKKFDAMILQAVEKIRKKTREGAEAPITFVDVMPFIHEMRLFKSATEMALMQKAVDISKAAHVHAMKICRPDMNECELEAVLAYEFKRQGAPHPAYTSIVGAGKNTCILHYIENNKKMVDGDLVLIDAGAEYQNYASDITRTFPVNGRFSVEQRAIYELVLESQLAGIQAVKPGLSWTAAQDAIVKVLTQGLIKLGILKGRLRDLIEKEAYLPFYMHRSGHWLGLDVHDVGSYKIKDKWRALKAGMVLTVEPGIYISAAIPGVQKRWHNIGVRIEDDVLVTQNGCRVLSQQIPKTIAEIEAIMAK